MRKFEHRTLNFCVNYQGVTDVVKDLNRLGAQGWEYVGVLAEGCVLEARDKRIQGIKRQLGATPMQQKYAVEYTDTQLAGEACCDWVKRATVSVPELTHYGYTGSTDDSYAKANRIQRRELMRLAKAAMGITGVRGTVSYHGDEIEFRPYKSCTVMYITYKDE